MDEKFIFCVGLFALLLISMPFVALFGFAEHKVAEMEALFIEENYKETINYENFIRIDRNKSMILIINDNKVQEKIEAIKNENKGKQIIHISDKKSDVSTNLNMLRVPIGFSAFDHISKNCVTLKQIFGFSGRQYVMFQQEAINLYNEFKAFEDNTSSNANLATKAITLRDVLNKINKKLDDVKERGNEYEIYCWKELYQQLDTILASDDMKQLCVKDGNDVGFDKLDGKIVNIHDDNVRYFLVMYFLLSIGSGFPHKDFVFILENVDKLVERLYETNDENLSIDSFYLSMLCEKLGKSNFVFTGSSQALSQLKERAKLAHALVD